MSVIQFAKSNDGLLELRFEVEIFFCILSSSDNDSLTSLFSIGIISFRIFNDEYKNPKSVKEKDTPEYQWLYDLLALLENSSSQEELIENSKIKLFLLERIFIIS